ncbi:nSTAND1 domain-containing NTPase, partial [Phormidium sp. CCY1219]|uniref:WD40 domain-containing protein n=1 Tax=Phormidium sp. CCY1219 TaxID=2886104 RepID=UPI002D1F14DE
DEISAKLTRLAPDFESWGSLTEFAIAPEELIASLKQTSDRLFAKLLENGEGRFLDRSAFNLQSESSLRRELETARQQLQDRGVTLEPSLAASVEFLIGRLGEQSQEQARHHYERSLALFPPDECLERRSCVLYYLGVWWNIYAVQHCVDFHSCCERAQNYFQDCIETFDRAKRPDLLPNFINAWGEVLQRLADWDKLEAIATRALALHQTHPSSFRLARCYGFLAEVALGKNESDRAKKMAEKALSIVADALENSSTAASENSFYLDWVRSYHQSWYWFALGRAQAKLGFPREALDALETAKAQANPQYDLPLYISILQDLRSGYFHEGEYFQAFALKQERESIEQQYGLRAFVGAGRLQPKQHLKKIRFFKGKISGEIAPEIADSGRKKDVINLVNRISTDCNRLTVIHGQSGVGKSSIVQAGLIPALSQINLGSCDILPVLQQVYKNWIAELGNCLSQALKQASESPNRPATEAMSLSHRPLDSLPHILEQLRINSENHWITVLIFDQFEEFFFACKDPENRREFYQFLKDCLNLNGVKVVLSLREDYLHYLLECNNRLISLDVVNDNILDKNIIYYLGNFSPKDAREIIHSLTQTHQCYLEPDLIDELVQDLARDAGEVRPIELQIVGAQLQTENITSLPQYKERGPKEKLVERYLAEVVQDCGPENRKTAELVLYLLTDEHNTRPLKTQAELTAQLADKADGLEVVLEIFVKSGLVFLLPDKPTDRYQLVHDYLVSFIRQQKNAELMAQLQWEREQRQCSEAKINQVFKWALFGTTTAVLVLGILTTSTALLWRQAEGQKYKAQSATIQALNSESEARLLSSDRLGALLASVSASKQVQNPQVPAELQQETAQRLQNVILTPVRERNRLPHGDRVTRVRFSPDGDTLASASEDKKIRIWGRDGTLLRTLEGHEERVTSVSFSPDGETLASASHDGTIKLWRRDGTLLQTIRGEEKVFNDLRFSPDGEIIAAATTYTNRITLWRRDGTFLRPLEGHNKPVSSVSFSPDSQTLVSASLDGIIKIWQRDGTLLKTFKGHDDAIYQVVFDPEGEIIASASRDRTIKLWRRDGTWLKTLTGHQDAVNSVSFSPDGQQLASASNDQTIKLWRTSDGTLLETLDGHHSFVWDVNFSPDGKTLASASADTTVKLWHIDERFLQILRGHISGVTDISFSPDNRTIASASYDKTIRIWRDDGSVREIPNAHSKELSSISFSPDGAIIASASYDNRVKLWRPDGTPIQTLEDSPSPVKSVRFSPDAQIIAAASNDGTVKLWQRDGSLIVQLRGLDERVQTVSFSPDGQLIAAAADRAIALWQPDGKLLTHFVGHQEQIQSASFSPDGQILVTASTDRTIKLWQRDGTLLQTLRGHGAKVHAAIFSPDAQTLISASGDGTIALWRRDPETEKFETRPYKTLEGHRESVYSLRFSPDGLTLASASNDKTVILWTWEKVASLNLETLLNYGCNELQDYLQNNPSAKEYRSLCHETEDP